jgi:glycogen(starch) synthase
MRILYLCDEYPPGRHGGIGTAVQQLAREMVSQGHEVIVAGYYDWGYGGEDQFTDNGVKVYRYRRGLNSGWFTKKDSLRVRATYKLLHHLGALHRDIERTLPGYYRFLEKLIKEHGIDIIERPDFNEYVQYCKKKINIPTLPVPVIVKLHGTITYFLKEESKQVPEPLFGMERQVLEQANAIAGVSSYTCEMTRRYFGLKAGCHVLYNGIDTAAFPTSDHKSGEQVIFTGSLVAKKGIYQLMKAWNIVNTKLPTAKLQVYGKGPMGRVRKHLGQEASGTVFFNGHIPRNELSGKIASSALAVFPSYAECFAIAPMEAMASGTAVIYSTRTSGPELIRDRKDGLLADPDNVQQLADCIIELLENRSLRDMLSENGRQRVLSSFDIKTIAKQHTMFYERVLAKTIS